MKKILSFIGIIVVLSCQRDKIESYKINNNEYIIKTDSSNTLVNNKDTLKFYYLKNNLRAIVISNFIEPKYDTVEEDPFYFQTVYC